MRICIIGLGNELLGDDAAGPYVCQRLTGLLKCRSGVEIQSYCSQGLFPEYAEDVSRADVAVFIDAAVASNGHTCLQWKQILHEQLDTFEELTHSTPFHGLSLTHFLKLCKGVYGRLPKEILLYTILAQDFTAFNALSFSVRATCEMLIHMVFQRLAL